MKRLRKFLYLSSAERWLLVRATLLLAVIRLGLWLLPLRALRRVLARVMPTPAAVRNADQAPPKGIVWAVQAASRYVPAATCLTQALAVQVLFERRGYPARLRIGVARTGQKRLQAHAWVEAQDGAVVGAEELFDYAPLLALDGGRSNGEEQSSSK